MIAYTVVYKRADLIEYQYKTIRKFCPTISELVVGNNGPDFDSIQAECDKYGLRSIRGKKCNMKPGDHHSYMLNRLWREIAIGSGEHSLFLDMDVFPVRTTDPTRLLDYPEDVRASMVAVLQKRNKVCYPWPGLLAIRTGLPDAMTIRFNGGTYHGERCDTGGAITEYWDAHVSNDLRVACIIEKAAPVETGCHALIDDDWIHFRAASNWWRHPLEDEKLRSNRLKAFLTYMMDVWHEQNSNRSIDGLENAETPCAVHGNLDAGNPG